MIGCEIERQKMVASRALNRSKQVDHASINEYKYC